MIKWTTAALLASQLLYLPYSYADAAAGARLESENCTGCHAARFEGDEGAIYVRKNRIVNSYDQLIARVRFCEAMLGLVWFDDQIMDVVKHLNRRYYHFNNTK